MPQSPRLALLRCPAAKENAMIERGVIDEASLWSQSLLFMANICLLGNLNSYLKCAFCAFSLGKKRFTSRIPSDTIV